LSWHRIDARSGALLLTVQVQPNAKRTEVAGILGDALKIRINAPALDGRANECLLAFVAERLSVKRAQVSLLQGDTSRRKLVAVAVPANAGNLYPGKT
jgi:uncharacterized protein (TIGR00251 family)